jgi:ATP-dependent Lhr-like helicase
VIAQHGGVAPLRAWRILCKSGPFEAIDEPRMARLLRSLEARGLIRRSGDGTLFLDTLGERIVGHHSFYAAFATPEEYRLTASGQVLGTLPISFPVMTGLHLVFAGRRWRVLLVDDEKKVIDLAPAKGGRLPVFGGRGGWVHDEVRRQMLHVYCGTDMPAYLDAGAQSLLTEARQNFSRFGLAERSMVRDGDDTHLFLWAGDRAVQTVAIQLRAHGLCCAPAGGLVLHLEDADEQWVRACLGEILSSGPANAGQIAKDVENKRAEKYDHFLDDELLTEDFALRNLDPRGALVAIERALDLSLRLSWCTGVAGDQS